MSGDLFTYGTDNGCTKAFEGIIRTSLKITEEDFCIFIGECKVKYNQPNLCIHCRYKQVFDVPEMLNNYIERKEK